MSSEQFLLENIREFTRQAKKAYEDKSYNSAVTLFFKAIAVASDLFILTKKGVIPKNHTERFRILESEYPEIYAIMNKIFPVYQESYRIKLNREYAEVIENDLKRIIEITKIPI